MEILRRKRRSTLLSNISTHTQKSGPSPVATGKEPTII
ncbi:hypothetical protein EVA_12889 [gut metagenome]|uniref:Uncharacterized protein n=1 Tax=gut metagenome TaxID=749906 RepID=J9CG37_9ZZZZ